MELDKENLDQSVAGAMGMDNESNQEQPEQKPVETTEQEPSQDEETVKETTEKTEGAKNNSTIRQMREEIAAQKKEQQKLNNLLERIAKEQGVSREQLEQNLIAKEDERTSKRLEVPVEVATRLREQEDRIKELERQSSQVDFNNRVDKLRSTFNLSSDEAMSFLRDAANRGLNVTEKGFDLELIYKAINFEKLSKDRDAKIRQDVLNEIQKSKERSNDIPNIRTQGSDTDTQDSPKDFMKELFSNFK